MSLPDFIIGGAPKCGTSTLFDYLSQHPDVFATFPKEPHYFASEPLGRPVMQGSYSRAEYEALFADRGPLQIAGEGSTHYLHHSHVVAPFMASIIPDVRLIFCLRDPVERTYSHFLFRYGTAGPHTLGGCGSGTSFMEFARDPEIFAMGDYATNLGRFFEHFPPESILVILLEDLHRDPRTTMARVCEHIGVDSSFEFDLSHRSNVTGYAQWPALMPFFDRATVWLYAHLTPHWRRRLLRARFRFLFDAGSAKPVLSRMEREAVAALYRPGVARLANMIDRDLSRWVSFSSEPSMPTVDRAAIA